MGRDAGHVRDSTPTRALRAHGQEHELVLGHVREAVIDTSGDQDALVGLEDIPTREALNRALAFKDEEDLIRIRVGVNARFAQPRAHAEHGGVAVGGLRHVHGMGSVASPEGDRPLKTQQGMLIRRGLSCRLRNTGQDELVVYSMQTRQPTALVQNVASDVQVRAPIEYMNAKGIGSRIYAYVMHRGTIGCRH